LVSFGLILALLAVLLVQARQFAVVRETLAASNEFGILTLFESETEFLRLSQQWQRAADEREPLDAVALRGRYALWIERVALLRSEQAQRLLGDDPAYGALLADLDAFIGQADRALGNPAQTEPDRAFVQGLTPRLQALDAPVHRVSLEAARRLADELESRAGTVRTQSRLGLGLTFFLTVLTLAFASIALRQVRQLRERRQTLEELAASLRSARREAESASAAKSAFLANMSHEIRTPFQGLMGMLSLLRETGLTLRQLDYLRTATESADHLLALLNDILDMSLLESGRMTLAPTPVELRGLLRDVDALMRPQAMARSLGLRVDAEPAVPERVMADATRVKQIVFNLVSNAIKFSDQGTVSLDLRCRATAEGADGKLELEFVVTDTGVGMEEAKLAQLFSRFMQGDSNRQRRHGGSGLGLEISRNLARLMGGDIVVRSKIGEGSCFIFRLPAQALSEPVAPTAAGNPMGSGPSRQLKVLVAEDHPVNRQYMAALLETLGHDATFTSNGQEALQAARSRRFDVVLMDLHMPVLDGVGATRAIRALPDPAISTLPIVALTADAFPETRERCLVAGMNDFLTKPVSPQKLAASLRRLFGTKLLPDLPPGSAAPAGAGVSRPEHPPLVDAEAITLALQAMTPARLGSLICAFLDQGAQTVRRLRAAVRDAQPLELRVNAHAAKGAALNLGLLGLATTAEALQDGATHLPAHEIARLVQRFEDQLPQTRQAVKELDPALLPDTAHPITR
jgi:signal transduction histidine kinase/ActR/RegA family two-component response regulator/HPt (histidine-containing phosphotransfer) domain-containing protein